MITEAVLCDMAGKAGQMPPEDGKVLHALTEKRGRQIVFVKTG